MDKVLIIITGGPGTGKSHMTREITQQIPNLTVLSYDSIKEKNFDIFGYDNEEQKYVLNEFSLEEFYLQLQKEMWMGRKLLIEYPFYQRHVKRLKQLAKTYEYKVLTIHLYGDLKVIYERGIRRDTKDKRHPGHLTDKYHIENYVSEKFEKSQPITYDQFCEMMAKKKYDIQLGETIDVDVTDIPAISYKEVIDRLLSL